MIGKYNVLELIGKDTRQYHSCILTCYSFDFTYFEERVLSSLRLANIRNINILVDGKLLEHTLELVSGKEFRNRTYACNPVYCTGVFHPKILMLFGEKRGLLIVGSGNLTSAGMGTNDEIWAAYHLDGTDSVNAPIFGQVFSYLQQYWPQVKGFNKEKLEWIRQYSPWLEELPTANATTFIRLSSSREVAFLGNSKGTSIYKQLCQVLPAAPLSELTVISPFYDQNGELLQSLAQYLQPENFNCILEQDGGSFPIKLPEVLQSSINFYDWRDCYVDHVKFNERRISKLHAKLLHFKYKDGPEYLLIGSANATPEGFGTPSKDAVNGEACFLIKGRAGEQFLNELDVKLPAKTNRIKLTSLPDLCSRKDKTSDMFVRYPVKLLLAEVDGNSLRIYLRKPLISSAVVQVWDSNGKLLFSCQISPSSEIITCTASSNSDFYRVCLSDRGGEQLSNTILVHHIEQLQRTSPNQKLAELEKLCEDALLSDGGNISELLEYVRLNWAEDEGSNTTKNSMSSPLRANDGNTYTLEVDETKMSEAEFNQVSTEHYREKELLMSPNVRVAEVLNKLGSQLERKSDFEESEEQLLAQDNLQNGEGGGLDIKSHKFSDDRKIKLAIHKLCKKLADQFSTPVIKDCAPFFPDRKDVTIVHTSSLLIIFSLLHRYVGKSFEYIDQSDSRAKATFRNGDLIESIEYTYLDDYFPEHKKGNQIDSQKGILSNLFGRFLLHSIGGYKKYGYESVNIKLKRQIIEVASCGIFWILNTPWSSYESATRDTLLLNALHFLRREDESLSDHITELKKGIAEEKTRLEKQRNKTVAVCHSYHINYQYFFEELIPAYVVWSESYKTVSERASILRPINVLPQESIIFKSSIGFAALTHYSKLKDDYYKLAIARAGFKWSDQQQGFVLSDVVSGKSVIALDVVQH